MAGYKSKPNASRCWSWQHLHWEESGLQLGIVWVLLSFCNSCSLWRYSWQDKTEIETCRSKNWRYVRNYKWTVRDLCALQQCLIFDSKKFIKKNWHLHTGSTEWGSIHTYIQKWTRYNFNKLFDLTLHHKHKKY